MTVQELVSDKGLESLTPLTRGVISRIDRLPALSADESAAALAQIRDDIQVLATATGHFQKNAECDRELSLRKLNEVEAKLAESRAQDEALRQSAERLRGQIAEYDRRGVDLGHQELLLRQQIEELQQQIRDRHARLEELKAWFWVPGYGQYLTIRTLVDNDLGELTSTQDSLANVARGLEGASGQRAEAMRRLESLRFDLTRLGESQSAQERAAGLLQAEHLRHRHNWDFAVQAVAFWAQLRACANDAHERAATIGLFVEFMDRNVPSPAIEGAAIVYKPLREALIDFAHLYDKAYETVLNPMTIVASYPLLSPAQIDDLVGGNGALVLVQQPGSTGALHPGGGAVVLKSDSPSLVTSPLRELDLRRFTVSVDFNVDRVSQMAFVICAGAETVAFGFEEDGKPTLFYRNEGGMRSSTGEAPVAAAAWHEAKIRYDEATHTLALFIDDERVCTAEVALHWRDDERHITLNKHRIGGSASPFSGALRNLKIKSAIHN